MSDARSNRSADRFVHRHLPYLLARASHALWRGFEPHLRAAGLNSLEWRVLATLSDSVPLTVGELAAEVLAKQPTLTKSLDRLAAQGWVERRVDAADARRMEAHESALMLALGFGDPWPAKVKSKPAPRGSRR
jgi:DNA-binding transcriptional ArsR family regulator